MIPIDRPMSGGSTVSQVLHTSWAEVSVQMRAHHRRVVLNSEEILAFEMNGVHMGISQVMGRYTKPI